MVLLPQVPRTVNCREKAKTLSNSHSTMAIVTRITEALQILRARDKPRRDHLLSAPSMTETEEDWLDNVSNHTELAQLLEELRDHADPDNHYRRLQEDGHTGAIDAALLEADSCRSAQLKTPDHYPNSLGVELRRSPRRSKSPQDHRRSVAVASSPANPTGLPGYRGYWLLDSSGSVIEPSPKKKKTQRKARCGPRSVGRMDKADDSPNLKASRKNYRVQLGNSSPSKSPKQGQLKSQVRLSSQLSTSSRVSTSQLSLSSQVPVSEVSDTEVDEPAPATDGTSASQSSEKRGYLAFFKPLGGNEYRCRLCEKDYSGVRAKK